MFKKKYDPAVLQFVTTGFCVLLLMMGYLQTREIRELRRQVDSVENRLMVQTVNLQEQVRALSEARTGEQLVSDYSLQLTGADPERRSYQAEASLALREWREDTQVWFLLEGAGGEIQRIPASGGGGYRAALDLPADMEAPSLWVEAETDGLHQKELLDDSLWDMDGLLPVQGGDGGWDAAYASAQKALRVDECSIILYDPDGNPAEVSGAAFLVSVNGETVLTEPARQNGGEWLGPLPEQPWEIPCGEGDEVQLHFSCRDRLGMTYTFLVGGKQIQQNRSQDIRPEGKLTPKISWPAARTEADGLS